MIGITEISLFSILLPSGMVFFTWNRLLLPLKIICCFILFTFLLEIISSYLMFKGINNMPLFHLFTFGESVFLVLYFQLLSRNKIFRLLITIFLISFLIYSICSVIFVTSLYAHPSSVRYIECILQMILCLFFFADLFGKSEVKNLLYFPHYWMASGLLLYFSGTFFMNIVSDSDLVSDEIGFDVYTIHSILNIFLNIIYTIVLWLGSKESISVR